jgi:hypothetical protein
MARRRRRTLEERIAAAEEQLDTLRTKRRLTYKEHRVHNDSLPEQRIPPRVHRSGQRETAWERLSVDNNMKHKRRELAKLTTRWERRDEERAQYVGQRILPYHIRSRFNESHYWHSRLRLEADILDLEGAPSEQITRLRWAADQTVRRGKLVSPDKYVPPPAPGAEAAKERVQELREWRPKPPERDVLRDYRGNSDYAQRRLEPEFV